jgi:hypothetical protein
MKRYKHVFACLISGLFLLVNAGTAASTLSLDSNAVMQPAAAAQVPFIQNDGQIDDEAVGYYARLYSGTLFVTTSGDLVYSLWARRLAGVDGESIHARWSFRESFMNGNSFRPAGRIPAQSR